MIQGTQWPSFIIQGIILGTDIYLVANANIINIWLLLSIFAVLILFALQATSERFIYLFPVIRGTSIPFRHVDTHILRIIIMLSSLFLYLGIRDHYLILQGWWFIVAVVALIFLVPLAFNFYLNEKIEKNLQKKVQSSLNSRNLTMLIDKNNLVLNINDNEGNYLGKAMLTEKKIIWTTKEGKKQEISWSDFISIIES